MKRREKEKIREDERTRERNELIAKAMTTKIHFSQTDWLLTNRL